MTRRGDPHLFPIIHITKSTPCFFVICEHVSPQPTERLHCNLQRPSGGRRCRHAEAFRPPGVESRLGTYGDKFGEIDRSLISNVFYGRPALLVV